MIYINILYIFEFYDAPTYCLNYGCVAMEKNSDMDNG